MENGPMAAKRVKVSHLGSMLMILRSQNTVRFQKHSTNIFSGTKSAHFIWVFLMITNNLLANKVADCWGGFSSERFLDGALSQSDWKESGQSEYDFYSINLKSLLSTPFVLIE